MEEFVVWVCPQLAPDSRREGEFIGDIVRKAVARAGFDEMGDKDVEDLLDSYREELSTEELRRLEQNLAYEESEKVAEVAPVKNVIWITFERFSINTVSDFLKNLDSNASRSGTVVHEIRKALAPYPMHYTMKSNLERLFN